MIRNPEGRLAVYGNTAGAYYGKKVVDALNALIDKTPSEYDDDNQHVKLKSPVVNVFPITSLENILTEGVSGEDAYLIQWFPRPPGDEWLEYTAPRNAFEFFHAIAALLCSRVKRVTLVTPYAFDQRNDVQTGRQAVGATVFVKLLDGLINKDSRCINALCLDMHAQQVVGTYQSKNIGMVSVPLFETYVNFLKEHYPHTLENAIIAMPDVGASKRGRTLSDYTGLRRVVFDKQRLSPTRTVSQIYSAGKIRMKGKTALIFDDVLGTGSTAADASRELKKRGIEKIYWLMSHLEGTNMPKLDGFYAEGLFQSIFIADTIRAPRDYFIEVPTAPLMAQLIYNLHTNQGLHPYLQTKPKQ